MFGLGVGSLLPTYVQRSARALVLALNDPGRLGVVTRALLKLQHTTAGPESMQRLAGASCFYITLKQLAVAQSQGITVTEQGAPYTPALNTLLQALHAVRDGVDSAPPLPLQYVHPLTELGLDLQALVDKNTGRHLISSAELPNLFAKKSLVKHRHKLALNRLSLALSAPYRDQQPPELNPPKYPHTQPLAADLRQIPDTPAFAGLIPTACVPNPALAPTLTQFSTQGERPPAADNESDGDEPQLAQRVPSPVSPATNPAGETRGEAGTDTARPNPARTRPPRRRKRAGLTALQEALIANNTRCDNQAVRTDKAKIHQIPTPSQGEDPPVRLDPANNQRVWLSNDADVAAYWEAVLADLDKHKLESGEMPNPEHDPTAYQALPPPGTGRIKRAHPTTENQAEENLPVLDATAVQQAFNLCHRAEGAAGEAITPLAPWQVLRARVLGDRLLRRRGETTVVEHQLTYDLYNQDGDIAAVVAGPFKVRHTTTAQVRRTQRQNKRRHAANRAESHETQYTVTWPDTYLPVCALRAYIRQGYEYQSLHPAEGKFGPALEPYFRRVVWKPTNYADWNIARFPSGPTALAQYRNTPKPQTCPKPPSGPKPRDTQLTPAQRQGRWQAPDIEASARRRKVCENTTITTESQNPYTDIRSHDPRPTIQIGLRDSANRTKSGTEGTAYAYDARGSCVGTLTLQHLHILRTRWLQAQRDGPTLHDRLTAGSFETDVVLLLQRYQRDADGKRGKAAPPQRNRARQHPHAAPYHGATLCGWRRTCHGPPRLTP